MWQIVILAISDCRLWAETEHDFRSPNDAIFSLEAWRPLPDLSKPLVEASQEIK